MASSEAATVPGSDPDQYQARLTVIEARFKALADAEDNASWGRAASSRGGFRQARADLLRVVESIRADRG